ncbi:MAG: SpoIIE family protein phosphatase [Phycisphaerae bacterium]|nr:SpoIIE family protein phosphatase [Phycisphaerae bacterium]
MTIRVRLLRVMLVIALAPMLLVALDHHLSTRRIQSRVENIAFESLENDARNYLQGLVGDYVRIVERDRELVAMTVLAQAREVENRLCAPPPKPSPVFLNVNYDKQDRLPDDMQTLDKYFRLDANQKKHPIPVSFREQVFVIAPGVNPESVQQDMARLSTMPEAYARLYQFDPSMKTWMYTALESGFHSSYPGHGGYPGDYDPRVREWYRKAKQQDTLEPVWTIFPDVSTRTVTLTCSMSVFRPNGDFAGVTAIDVPLASVLNELHLPTEWKKSSRVLHALVQPADRDEAIRLTVFNQKSYEYQGLKWKKQLDFETLRSDNPKEMIALLQDVAEGRPGVRRMGYQGRDMLWAYSVYGDGELVSVILVPYEQVVAGARRVDAVIEKITREALGITGFILLWVIVLVVLLAFRRSRMLTQPIRQLADGAKKLTGGDFDARVEIHTRDELEELGNVFNATGPALREREKMKESLALAMEVQQHLLPHTPPKLEGFDIAGASRYSDETGGDYYDFIDLAELGDGKVGIAVGDITGHGIGAALLMASARAVLRSHVATHGDDLGKMFEDINVHLVRDTGDERFLTLFYGLLDAKHRTLRWVSGGHDPAVWLHGATGQIEELQTGGGMVLGVLEDVPYKGSGPITLEPGDILAVGTDGIWEAKNSAGDMFTRRRMFDVILANADKSAAEIHQAVVEAVVAFHEGAGPQEDDITLVIVKAL